MDGRSYNTMKRNGNRLLCCDQDNSLSLARTTSDGGLVPMGTTQCQSCGNDQFVQVTLHDDPLICLNARTARRSSLISMPRCSHLLEWERTSTRLSEPSRESPRWGRRLRCPITATLMNDSVTGSTAIPLGSRKTVFRDTLLSKENAPVTRTRFAHRSVVESTHQNWN